MAPNVRVQRRTQRVRGTPIVPIVVPNVLVVISVADHGYARVSLGRSIGYVPADRGIITSGPYEFVRHPIYSGLFVTLFAFMPYLGILP